MNYFIYGQETYSIKKHINNIIDNIVDKEIISVDAGLKSFDIKQIIAMANRISFFQMPQVIILNNCNFLRAKGKIDEKDVKALEDYFKQPNHDTTLIFTLNLAVDEKVDSRKKVYKLLVKYCETKSFEPLKKADFEYIVYEELKNVDIDRATISLLLERLPIDLLNFHNELDKMQLYGEKIDAQYINQSIVSLHDDKIFDLINFIIKNDKRNALLSLNDLIISSADAIGLLYSLSGQFRFMFKVKHLVNQGYNKAAIVEQLKQNPYYIENTMRNVSYLHINRILSILSSLSELDVIFKSDSNADRNLLLELFVLKELNICNL